METTTVVTTFPNADKRYTFRIEMALGQTLQRGDLVVGETAFGISVLEVVGVHREDQYDPTAGFEWKWVFGRVPVEHLEVLKSSGQSFLD